MQVGLLGSPGALRGDLPDDEGSPCMAEAVEDEVEEIGASTDRDLS